MVVVSFLLSLGPTSPSRFSLSDLIVFTLFSFSPFQVCSIKSGEKEKPGNLPACETDRYKACCSLAFKGNQVNRTCFYVPLDRPTDLSIDRKTAPTLSICCRSHWCVFTGLTRKKSSMSGNWSWICNDCRRQTRLKWTCSRHKRTQASFRIDRFPAFQPEGETRGLKRELSRLFQSTRGRHEGQVSGNFVRANKRLSEDEDWTVLELWLLGAKEEEKGASFRGDPYPHHPWSSQFAWFIQAKLDPPFRGRAFFGTASSNLWVCPSFSWSTRKACKRVLRDSYLWIGLHR